MREMAILEVDSIRAFFAREMKWATVPPFESCNKSGILGLAKEIPENDIRKRRLISLVS